MSRRGAGIPSPPVRCDPIAYCAQPNRRDISCRRPKTSAQPWPPIYETLPKGSITYVYAATGIAGRRASRVWLSLNPSLVIPCQMKKWTCAASLLLAIAACDNAPTAPTAPLAPEVPAAGVPGAGPLSTQGPVAGPLSLLSPQAGPMSAESPQREASSGDVTTIASAGALPGWTANAREYEPAAGNTTAAIVSPAMRLLWQNTSTGDRSIWLMSGATWDGSSYALLPTVSTTWTMQASGDFNADGNSDIVWQNTVTGDRSIWFMSNTTWGGSYALLPSVALAWSIAGAGDFNADGKPDLVWQNTTTGDRSIWFMNGSTWDGTFAMLPSVDPNWRIAAVADMNADNKPDLIWQNIVTGQRSIWFMNGSTWGGSYALLPTVATSWRIAGAADFDGDTKPDLVWQNLTTGQRSIWIMNGATWDGTYSLLPTIATAWSIAGTLAPPAAAAARIALTPYPAIVDVAATLPTAVTAYDGASNPVSTPPLTYTSRNTGVATVSSGGVVTGVARGQTILVAAVTSTPSIADSVVVVVTAVGGPALYTDISKFGYPASGNITVTVFLDMRGSGKTLGSTVVEAIWGSRTLTFAGWTASGPAVSPEVNTGGAAIGIFYFDMANAAGISGKVELLRFTLSPVGGVGATGTLNLISRETNAGDLTDMTSQTTGISYPIILK